MKKLFVLTSIILLLSVIPAFSGEIVKNGIKKTQQELKKAIAEKNETNFDVLTGSISSTTHYSPITYYLTTDEGEKYTILNPDPKMFNEIRTADNKLEKKYTFKCEIIKPKEKTVILKPNSGDDQTLFYGNVVGKNKTNHKVNYETNHKANYEVNHKTNSGGINVYEIYESFNPDVKYIKK